MSENLKKEMQLLLTLIAIGLGLWFGGEITRELIMAWLPVCFLIGLLRTSLFIPAQITGITTVAVLLDFATGLLVGIGLMLGRYAIFSSQVPVEVKEIAQTNLVVGIVFFGVGALIGARATLGKYHP